MSRALSLASSVEVTSKTAEEKRWIRAWMTPVKRHQKGKVSFDKLMRLIRDKVDNAADVRKERIKRADRAGQSIADETWVTIVAEPDVETKEDISEIGIHAMACSYARLQKRGFDFYVEWKRSPSGVGVISFKIFNLRQFMRRKAEEKRRTKRQRRAN